MIRLRSPLFVFVVGFLVCSSALFAQQKVDPRNRYERIVCIVPMIGSGTYEDPRRPAYVPTDSEQAQTPPGQGWLGYSSIVSDDGQWALVELVAADRKVFATILADAKGSLAEGESPIPTTLRSDFKVFQKGTVLQTTIERAFRKFKPNFTLDLLEVDVP